MKIRILQENLIKTLVRINRVIPARPQLPVLQNVFLSVKNGIVSFIATNMETTEKVLCPAKIEQEGESCVTSKTLSDLVSSLPQGEITMSKEGASLTVESASSVTTIPTSAVEEFPPFPEINKKTKTTVDKTLFSSALTRVLFAAATDEGRPILTGIRVIASKGEATLAATDGYRLSVFKTKLSSSQEMDMIIPARALSEIVKIGAEEKSEATISLSQTTDGQLVFFLGNTTIITKLIDGEFPNFEKIIPATHTTRAVIDREQFVRAARTASVFAKDNANIIKMRIAPKNIEISANTPQVGENVTRIDASIEGDGGEIAFNSRFLTEFLANSPEGEIEFEMIGSLNPGVFKIPCIAGFLHIIMPVRVQN